MKKLLPFALLFPLAAYAGQITVPSAPSAGYGLVSTTTGAYIASTTSPLIAGSGVSLSGSAYIFGPSSVTISATGGPGVSSLATSSTETPGFVPFWTSTAGTPATLSGGTSDFVWDGTNSRLGIGTSTPYANLSVGYGDDLLSHPITPLFAVASTSATGARTNIVTVTSQGRVGIDTATPSTSLHVAGSTLLAGTVETSGTITSGNFGVSAAITSANTTVAGYMVAGATGLGYRVLLGGGTTATVQTANADYASVILPKAVLTEAASGNHPLLTQLAIRPLSVTAGVATVSTTSSLYIEDAATTTTVTGGNYSIYVAHGDNYFNGNLTNNGTLTFPSYSNGLLFAGADGSVSAVSTSTWTFASSTLLADSNIFSGTNTFSNPISGSITGNAGTVTNGVYTTTFGTLFDNRLSASSSISGITTLPNLSLPLTQTTGTLAVNRGGTNATSQTTNGVMYFDGTSVTSGSTFIFDGTKVGIGTTSPLGKLHVSSGGSGVGSTSPFADDLVVENSTSGGISILTPAANIGAIYFANTSNNGMGRITYSGSTDQLGFGAGGGTQAVFDGTSWYNFGTTNPNFRLSSNSVNAYLAIDTTNQNGWTGTAGSYPFNIRTNNTVRVTVDPTGMVGIGSTTPYGLFSVNATSALGSAPAFVVGSSSQTSLKVDNAGKTIITDIPTGYSGVASGLRCVPFQIATSTAWTGTTTAYMQGIAEIVIPFAGTIRNVRMHTDAGTLWFDLYHTSTHLALVQASTTQGVYTYTSNNTFSANESIYASAGTPASSPTAIHGTLCVTETP